MSSIIQKHLRAALFSTFCAFCSLAAALPATPATNGRPDNGIYYIRTATSKYLGIAGIDLQNGAGLIQWDFATLDNHKFEVQNQADGSILIKAVHSGRYLNVEGQSRQNNARIIQWDYVNQGNLKFWLIANFNGDGSYMVQCEQSRMYWNIHGGNHITENGHGVVQFEKDGQWFFFEPVSDPLRPEKMKKPPGLDEALGRAVTFEVPGGGKITRRINPTMIRSNKQADTKSNPKLIAEDDFCQTFTAKVSSVEKDEVMTISNGNLIENFAPGLVYDIKALFNGDILNKEKYRYGENRLPIQLTTTVRNFNGNNNAISERVDKPDKVSINQAIANFYQRHTTKAERTSMQNARYYSCAITSKSEFAMKVGAGGHYAFFSLDASFDLKNARAYKTLYFEGTKELFTLSARPATAEGFFETAPPDAATLGYISAVTYGLRIIGKVEVENKHESMKGDLKAAFEAGIAGVNVSLSSYTASDNSKTIVTLYAVGGRADKIGSCTVDNIEATIDNFLRSANYQVAQPIKLQFSTLEGQVMRFMDATDDFTYTLCQPAAVAQGTKVVTLSGLLLTAANPETDYDFYGKIWAKAYDKAGIEIPETKGNMLMNVDGAQEIDLDNKMTFQPNTEARFIFPDGRAMGGQLHIYYALFDQDANTDWATGDDDQFSFVHTDQARSCELGPTSQRWCKRIIYLDDAGAVTNLKDYLWNAQDQTGVDVLMQMKISSQ